MKIYRSIKVLVYPKRKLTYRSKKKKKILVPETNVIQNETFNVGMINEKIQHLDNVKRSKILNLIKDNDFVLAKSKFDVGNVTKYECIIPLSSNKYVSKKPYRCTYADQQQIESQVADLLEHGWILSLIHISEPTRPY